MKGRDALFSHASDEWGTPQWLFDLLNKEFKFDADAAASEGRQKCDFYFTPEVDALISNWSDDTLFLNPPYSKIGAFMQKAYESSLLGATVVCLIPARTDTRYFHDYCMKAYEIRLIRGRVKFTNPYSQTPLTSATFPSCIVIFGGNSGKYWHHKRDPNFIPRLGKPIDSRGR